MITRDKIAGAVYGLALGDALGRDTEFMKLKSIHKAYGSYGYMPLPFPALFTDDTQMSIAVARALADARHFAPKELVRTLTNEFLRWKSCDEPRAPGGTCMRGIAGLLAARKLHRSWIYASQVNSKGCGANMRVLPTALMVDFKTAMGASQLQAALTHGHPLALAATELTALAIRWAADGVIMDKLPGLLFNHAVAQEGIYRRDWLGALDHRWRISGEQAMRFAWQRMQFILTNVESALKRDSIKDVCAVLGGAWVAEEALACALYFAVKYVADPTYGISMAARTDGDSDSIACIAGAILGAHSGEGAWPTEWTERIERRNDLEWSIKYMASQYA